MKWRRVRITSASPRQPLYVGHNVLHHSELCGKQLFIHLFLILLRYECYRIPSSTEIYMLRLQKKTLKRNLLHFPAIDGQSFLRFFDEIAEAISGLISKQYVQLNLPIGGEWHVSVTTGFACVKIRKYYYNHGWKRSRSSMHGIALRLPEWVALNDVIPQLHKQYPAPSTATPCSTQVVHRNLEGYSVCRPPKIWTSHSRGRTCAWKHFY